MRWSFLTQWSSRKTSKSKTEFNKKSKKLSNKRRLADLFCTMRNQSMVSEHPMGHRKRVSRGNCLTTLENTILDSDTDSFSDLFFYHSMKAHYPTNKLNGQLLLTKRRSRYPRYIPTPQPAFCPTCQNVVIPLPQKRPNSSISNNDDDDEEEEDVTCAKRMRPSIEWDNNSTWKLQLDDSTLGQPDPIYEDVHSDTQSAIYSEVASSVGSCTTMECPQLVEVPPVSWEPVSPTGAMTSVWDPLTAPFGDECSTYVTTLVDDVFFIPSESLTEKDCVGEPWLSSTLKRGMDTQTIYDEVASDREEEFIETLKLVAANSTREWRQDDLFWNGLSSSDVHVKRARREYFVCEE